MQEYFVLVLIGATSAAAYAVGARALGLSRRAIGPALGRLLESLGAIVIFFVANLLAGGAALLAARAVGAGFVSLYLADDATLLVLSALQGLAFQAWRECARRRWPAPGPADPGGAPAP